jgi:hypothetical protein
MSTSQDRIDANRLNAHNSTGPKTPEGKRRSSRNATTHGLYCRDLVLECESESVFLAMREEYVRRLNPQDALELSFVDRMAACQWKLNRILSNEKLAVDCRENSLRQKYIDRRDGDDDDGYFGQRSEHTYCSRWEKIDEEIEGMTDEQFAGYLGGLGLDHASYLLLMMQKNEPVLERFDRMRVRLENSISKALRELRLLQTKPRNLAPQIPSPFLADAEENLESAIKALRTDQEKYDLDLDDPDDLAALPLQWQGILHKTIQRCAADILKKRKVKNEPKENLPKSV